MAFDTPIIVCNMLHIKDHYGRYQIYGKVMKLTIMLQTSKYPLHKYHQRRAPSSLQSQSTMLSGLNTWLCFNHLSNELQTLPDLPYPYSLMATKFNPQVPSIYATYILCVVGLYSASKTNFDWNSNRHQQESYM